MDAPLQKMRTQMSQSLTILREDLGTIRAGRASAQLIESVRIAAYDGAPDMALSELATISSSDAKTLLVTPFDQSVADKIERGLNMANLGVSVVRDGAMMRVIIPPMTEERRQEFIKLAKTKTEGVLVIIRQARQEAMNDIRDLESKGDISEDDKFRIEKEIQKETDDHSKKANELLENKVSELQTV